MKRTILMRMGLLVLIIGAAVGVQLFPGWALASDYDEGELIIKFDEAYSSDIDEIKTELDVYETQVLQVSVEILGGYRTTWSL